MEKCCNKGDKRIFVDCFFSVKRFFQFKRFPEVRLSKVSHLLSFVMNNSISVSDSVYRSEKGPEDNNLQYYESCRSDGSDPEHIIDWVSLKEAVIDVQQLIDKAKTSK
jgi:hypothetical protein